MSISAHSSRLPRTAIVGGGAAGFFAAINLKEMQPEMQVTIFERAQRVLSKVAVSGGGRCNCTNSFRDVVDLSAVYPRGHRLLKRLMHQFGPADAYRWFEKRGVPLVTQDDQCVFPAAQDSGAIIGCFLSECRRLGIEVRTGAGITSLDELSAYDYVVVTTGGQPRREGLAWLEGHEIVNPVPSLFSLAVDDAQLHDLMGAVVPAVTVAIPGTKMRATGTLLVTHWGLSGPAVLRLSSYAARHLHDCQYRTLLSVGWAGADENQVREELTQLKQRYAQRQPATTPAFGLTSRLWTYLMEKTLGERAHDRWSGTSARDLNRLVNTLCNDQLQVSGRAAFKDEFVTCGGVSLSAVNPSTLESRVRPGLYFAGEVLDIDGVTGGFNFQAAWTTAYAVATAISRAEEKNNGENEK